MVEFWLTVVGVEVEESLPVPAGAPGSGTNAAPAVGEPRAVVAVTFKRAGDVHKGMALLCAATTPAAGETATAQILWADKLASGREFFGDRAERTVLIGGVLRRTPLLGADAHPGAR